MFTTHTLSKDGLQIITLTDTITNTSVEIIPECGATLRRFEIDSDIERINVVHSYSSPEEFRKTVGKEGFPGCKLSPFVCRINKGEYNFEGRDYKLSKFYLGENALHGLLYDREFNVVSLVSGVDVAELVMKHEYRGEDEGFPFHYDCYISYELYGENVLNVTTECVNMGNCAMPLQDGWHPYFRLGGKVDEWEMKLRVKEMVEFDDALIPTGKLVEYGEFEMMEEIGGRAFDNCFVVDFSKREGVSPSGGREGSSPSPTCVIRSKERGIQIEISPEDSYPYLQLYVPGDRKSIAIENLSSPPDGFNNHMSDKILEKGDSAIFKTSYQVKLIS